MVFIYGHLVNPHTQLKELLNVQLSFRVTQGTPEGRATETGSERKGRERSLCVWFPEWKMGFVKNSIKGVCY